ncbi:Ribosomal large subunit pseudouridine synthase C [Phytophthora citrophthora]|uniref:Ribosomal large subunit pseudouridine synthase C n=1 Tax=Phytophthora citrophthora TaxID=4793 RepID=A0AAD9G2T3_9STRA|nr:Ribosomal large subunit pseudouridine synthase C [Phytophthora citrophthora]
MWSEELRWMRHVVRAADQELRLDRWLRRQFPGLPQSFLQTQLRKRKIRFQVDTVSSLQTARGNSQLLEGSVVAIDAHLFKSKLQPLIVQQLENEEAKRTQNVNKKRLQLLLQSVVHQDKHFVVLNKPNGLAVQDGSALKESLARYLPSIAQELGAGDDEEELRLVHRLDKETSGVLVLARSRLAAAKFSELLRSGTVHKTYVALVAGSKVTEDSYSRLQQFEGRELKFQVDGKPACTLVERVWTQDRTGVWLQLQPHTGRKHQLRVHCAQELEVPIIGDTKYGGRPADRLYLHAKRIRFPDPFTSGQIIDVRCKMEPTLSVTLWGVRDSEY